MLAAARELGYTPSSLARSFARRRSGNLGVVMPDLPKARLFSAYYFSEILSGIGSKAREEGYDLLVIFRGAGEPQDYCGLFRMRKIDACIVLGAKEEPGELAALRLLHAEGHPYCLINQHFEGEGFHEVDADHVAGTRQATEHLLAQGFRRIAFLNGPAEYSNSRDRRRGFESALAEAGLPPEPALLLQGNFSRRSGVEAARTVAAQLERIDAIVVANDRMAIGLQQGLRELGVSPGRMPAIVGYDDSDAAELTQPALSSVRVPFFELGALAAARVLELPEGEAGEAISVKLPTRLVVRASSITTKEE